MPRCSVRVNLGNKKPAGVRRGCVMFPNSVALVNRLCQGVTFTKLQEIAIDLPVAVDAVLPQVLPLAGGFAFFGYLSR